MENQRRVPLGGSAFLVIGALALAVVLVSVTRIAIGESENFWTPLGSALTLVAMIIGFAKSRNEQRRRARADEGGVDARP